jgi:spore coat polysaccharide biosynthesis predicted glycosyltransferase SpsG
MAEFIAEIPSRHHGDLDRCRRLIAEAARVGCAGVAFRYFRVDKLFAPEILRVSAEHRMWRRRELPRRFVPALAACARDHGLRFGAAPCDLDAVDVLAPHVDFLKIAPHQLPWLDLIHACAATGLPLVISTGMADAGEAWSAVETSLESECRDLTLLHCVRRFPVAEQDCNLAAIGTLRELMDRNFAADNPDTTFRAGWSDHSVSNGVLSRVQHHWAADVIEFRFDLENADDGGEPCWLPSQIAPVIGGGFRPIDPASDGTGRIAPLPADLDERPWRADVFDGLRPVREMRLTWPARQPEARRSGPDAFFLVDGAGLGHVARCIALAEQLRDVHDADVLFFVRDDAQQHAMLDRHGFNWDTLPEDDSLPTSVNFLTALSRSGAPPVCVLDADRPVDDLAAELRGKGRLVVVVGQPAVTTADLGVVPDFAWQAPDDRPDLAGGLPFLLVRGDVTARRGCERGPETEAPRIVVSFGGVDPYGLTARAAAALHDLRPDAHVQVVVAPGFAHAEMNAQVMAARFGEQEIITGGDPLETVLDGADLLVTALGVSVGEALALGVPVALLANHEHDAPAAAQLAATGAAVDLGHHAALPQIDLCAKLAEIIQADTLAAMKSAAAGLVDGRGAARAAERIMALVAAGGGRS